MDERGETFQWGGPIGLGIFLLGVGALLVGLGVLIWSLG